MRRVESCTFIINIGAVNIIKCCFEQNPHLPMFGVTLNKTQVSKKKYTFAIGTPQQPIGTCTVLRANKLDIAGVVSIKLPQECWVIDEIEVKEGFRGNGSGTELLRYSLKEVEAIAKLPVVLMPPKSEYTPRILEWYKRHGFKPTAEGYWQRDYPAELQNP